MAPGAPPAAAAAAADGPGPPTSTSTATSTVCLWSGPRCCSTALMYSWAQRSDCDVADEPLYGAWARLTGAERPYLAELLAAQGPGDASAVFEAVVLAPRAAPLRFLKNMAKHRIGVAPALMRAPGLRHVLLLRDPARVIASFARVLPPTLGELGYSGAPGRRPVAALGAAASDAAAALDAQRPPTTHASPLHRRRRRSAAGDLQRAAVRVRRPPADRPPL